MNPEIELKPFYPLKTRLKRLRNLMRTQLRREEKEELERIVEPIALKASSTTSTIDQTQSKDGKTTKGTNVTLKAKTEIEELKAITEIDLEAITDIELNKIIESFAVKTSSTTSTIDQTQSKNGKTTKGTNVTFKDKTEIEELEAITEIELNEIIESITGKASSTTSTIDQTQSKDGKTTKGTNVTFKAKTEIEELEAITEIDLEAITDIELNKIIESLGVKTSSTTSTKGQTKSKHGKTTKGKKITFKAKTASPFEKNPQNVRQEMGSRTSVYKVDMNENDQPEEAKQISRALLAKYNIKDYNPTKKKDSKSNSQQNSNEATMLTPSKVTNKNNEDDLDVKQSEQKIEKSLSLIDTASPNFLTLVETTRPRHCQLLKPLIFPVPKGELLPWAKHLQNLVLSLVIGTKQPMPFYSIGRHCDMRSTVTADKQVLDLFKNFLQQRDAGWFSYTPKEELRSLLVLRKPKITKNQSTKEGKLIKSKLIHIEHELLSLKIAVQRIEKFKSKRRTNEKLNNLFLVEVSRETDLQKLFQTKKLLGVDGWRWSKLKNKRLTQCRNCQRYGHVAINCNMPYRCVKCKDPHAPGKCARIQNEDNQKEAYCHNCQMTGHSSNYRGCPVYKERVEAIKRHAKQSAQRTVRDRASSRLMKVYNKAMHL